MSVRRAGYSVPRTRSTWVFKSVTRLEMVLMACHMGAMMAAIPRMSALSSGKRHCEVVLAVLLVEVLLRELATNQSFQGVTFGVQHTWLSAQGGTCFNMTISG